MTTPPPDLLTMLRGLVASPSVSSVSPAFDQSNRGVIALLAGWLEGLGLAVEVLDVPGYPGKQNLVATLGRGPGGLVLAGHTDTVPYDEGRWRHDPFVLTEADGRLYGLGTSDMKGFFALAIEAVRGFVGRPLAHPLVILATADEESSMCGAIALARAGRPLGRYAVIGEPTGLVPVRMHKGILMEAVRLVGRSGHSSDPSLGVSALEGMHEVMGTILAWRAALQARHRNPVFAVPAPTLNLGHIHGGDNPNRICGECELHLDLRPLPGMGLERLRAELRERVARVAGERGLAWETRALFPGIEAVETGAGSPIVQAAEALTGQAAGAVAFATEAPYLKALGMDTVILGPGDIAQAHQPDEYLALDRLAPTVEVLRGLIERFCVGDG
jgi:acetylornithine deacetylase